MSGEWASVVPIVVVSDKDICSRCKGLGTKNEHHVGAHRQPRRGLGHNRCCSVRIVDPHMTLLTDEHQRCV